MESPVKAGFGIENGFRVWRKQLMIFCMNGNSNNELIHKIDDLINNKLDVNHLYTKDSVAKIFLILIADNYKDLLYKLQSAREKLNESGEIESGNGIYYQANPLGNESVVFLFPGQGSQYQGMNTRFMTLPYFKQYISEKESILKTRHNISLEKIYEDNTNTLYNQLRIGCVSSSVAQALIKIGLVPSYFAGHSYGEIPALHAAGVIDTEILMDLSITRNLLMDKAGKMIEGGMLAVYNNALEIEEYLLEHSYDLVVANINTSEQVVLSGEVEEINRFQKDTSDKFKSIRLNVDNAFHSEYMQVALSEWQEYLSNKTSEFNYQNEKNIYSNVTASKYNNSNELSSLLSRQIVEKVRWHELCQNIYSDGGRIFIEIGPGNVLTKMNKSIFKNDNVVTYGVDSACKSPANGIEEFFAILASHGLEFNKEIFFDYNNFDYFLKNRKDTIIRKYFLHNKNILQKCFNGQMEMVNYALKNKYKKDIAFVSIISNTDNALRAMEIPRASDKNIVQYEDDKNKTKLDTEPFVASNDICVDTLIQYIKKQESLFDGNDLCKNSFVLQSFFDKLFEKCSNYEMFKQELLGCNDLTEIEVLLRCFFPIYSKGFPDDADGEEINRYIYKYSKIIIDPLKDLKNAEPVLLISTDNYRLNILSDVLGKNDISNCKISISEKGEYVIDEAIIESFDMIFNDYFHEYKEIPSIIFIGAQYEQEIHMLSSDDWENHFNNNVISLFDIYKSIYNFINNNHKTSLKKTVPVLAIIGDDQCPVSSAMRGVLKTMSQDYKNEYNIKSLWLRNNLQDIQENIIMSAIFGEATRHDMFLTKEAIEIRGLTNKELDKTTYARFHNVNTNKNILALGAGNGITAEIVAGIVGVYQCNIYAVGRTILNEIDDKLLDMNEDTLKNEIYNLLVMEMGDDKLVTKEVLMNRFNSIKKSISIIKTKRRIEDLGGRFIYYSCDISDNENFRQLLSLIEEKSGGINAIIHGAGEYYGKSNKNRQDFEKSIITKRNSFFELYRFYRERKLDFVLNFSSISAYTGLPRMPDYSANNEFVNGFSSYWNERSKYPVKSIMWSLWSDVGIMRDSAKNIKQLGLKGISNEEGVQVFLQELNSLSEENPNVLLSAPSMLKFSMNQL
jgi:[acyl-carrier-protein] S-malonyltransferase